MEALEKEQRDRFVACALEYRETAYHHMGMVKGGGVDCATLLICAAVDAKLIEPMKLEYYPQNWHLHRASERYLATISKWCKEVPMPPLPGDIMLWKFGRSFSHAAIIVDWPTIIHAHVGRPVGLENALAAQWLTTIGEDKQNGQPRPYKLLSMWGRE